MHKAAVVLVLLVTVLLGSGCIVLPVADQHGTTPSKIEQGMARTEIVTRFGEPVAKTPDKRFVLYEYGGRSGFTIKSLSSYGVITDDSTSSYTGHLLLEFDDDDRVKRERKHRCDPADPQCDTDPTTSLLAMLEKYYDVAIVNTYRPFIGLCIAGSRGDHVTVEKMLAQDVDVNAQCPRGTPLHIAAGKQDSMIVEMLLANGANVDAKDKRGQTPLHIAAGKQDPMIVEMLLANGVDINVKDSYGSTPLHHAVWKESRTVVEVLLAKGADVNAKNLRGWTPLHNAVWKQNPVILEELLAAGASVNAVNKKGPTPLDFATDQKVIELLKQHGAKE